ncbi:hypothetical protein ACHAWF_007927 [Thalassiosira exigua]
MPTLPVISTTRDTIATENSTIDRSTDLTPAPTNNTTRDDDVACDSEAPQMVLNNIAPPENNSSSAESGTDVPSPSNRHDTSDPLNDPTNYIDAETFFELLQDPGVEPPDKERANFLSNPKLSKHRHIRFGPLLYPKIWRLSSTIFKSVLMEKREFLVPKMSKNGTNVVRMIGTMTLKRRFCKGRGDLHSAVTDTDQMELATGNPKFCEEENLYFLSQRELLSWILDEWGSKKEDEMVATADDRIRSIGIMFMEDMREYIRYVLQVKDPHGWMDLDQWSAKRNSALTLHHQRFIDREVVVNMPSLFQSDEAREKIDAHMGVGTYDSLNFNPNKLARIDIAWTLKDTNAILETSLSNYAAMMVKYTWGTGGGDGHPVVTPVWDERPALQAVTYIGKKARGTLYLAVFHIWDKEYNFPLTIVKGRVPPGAAIDDEANAAVGKTVTPTPPSSGKKMLATGEQVLIAAINSSAAAREKASTEISSAASALKSFIEGSSAAPEMSQTDKQVQLQDAIDHTNRQLEIFTSQKEKLEEQWCSIEVEKDDVSRATKRRKAIGKQIKIKERLIDEFNTLLLSHLDNLSKINGMGKNDIDESSSSGSDLDD